VRRGEEDTVITVGLTQRAELCDASGRVLAVLLPPSMIEAMAAECGYLRRRVAEIQEENAKLRQEVRETRLPTELLTDTRSG
jgi:hypothetical protein